MPSKTDIDQGWAWLVLIAVYSGILILSTSMFTAGVIFVELLDYYHEDAAKTSVIGSLNSGLLSLMGPLASFVSNRFSCRVSMFTGGLVLSLSYVASAFVDSIDILILVLGVIGGIGNSLISSPFVVVLAYYFEKRRDVFIALSTAVIGVAMFIASPVALYLLDTYGLKGTFFIVGGLCAQLCVCAVICRPSMNEINFKKTEAKNLRSQKEHGTSSVRKKCLQRMFPFFSFSLFINAPFLFFMLSTLTWNFMLSICLIHLPNYVVTKGLNESSITVVMTVYSVSNTVGRFIGAVLVSQKEVHVCLIHIFALACGGILTISFPLYSGLPFSAYVFAGFAGIFTGLPNSLMTAITMSLVSVEKISSAHGLEYFFCGIGYVSGPPLAGFLYERTNSYNNSFTLAAAVLMFGSILPIITYIHIRRKCSRRREEIPEPPR